MAEELGSGLQNRLPGCKSRRRLQRNNFQKGANMSKNKKKKFKKKNSQNIDQKIAEISKQAISKEVPVLIAPTSETPKPVNTSDSSSEKYTSIRKDLRRDLIMISILILILAGITILNIKTNYLQAVADWVYRTLNLKI